VIYFRIIFYFPFSVRLSINASEMWNRERDYHKLEMDKKRLIWRKRAGRGLVSLLRRRDGHVARRSISSPPSLCPPGANRLYMERQTGYFPYLLQIHCVRKSFSCSMRETAFGYFLYTQNKILHHSKLHLEFLFLQALSWST
jgi:hypothetical protein